MKSSHHHTLLLVEDDRLVAITTQKTLERFGYSVLTTSNGEAAVELSIERPEIALVLMDIDLGPGIDGTETARRILELRELPVVFLTSHAEQEYVERVEQITRYGYVLKGSGEFVLSQSIKMAFQLFDAHIQEQQREQRLTNLIEGAPVGIFQTTSDGKFRQANSEMARMLGFQSPEVLLKFYSDLGRQLYADPNRRNELLRLLRENGSVRDFSVEAYRATGETARFRITAQVLDENHEIDGGLLFGGYVVDDTERHHAEIELSETDERYQSIIQLSQELMTRSDEDGRWVLLNNEAAWFYGEPEERLLGRRPSELAHPEDRPKENAAWRYMAATGQPVHRLETRHWTPRGWRKVQWNCAPLLDADGEFAGHQATGRDVTDLVKPASRIDSDFRKWRELFEQATVGIILADTKHNIIDANPHAASILGYSREELSHLNARDLIHPEDFARLPPDENLKTMENTNAIVQRERRYRRRDGTYLDVLVSMQPLREVGYAFSHVLMFHDISARKRLEDRLRTSEAMFRSIAENAFDIFVLLDARGTIIYANPALSFHLGCTLEELKAKNALRLIDHRDRERAYEAFANLSRGRLPFRLPLLRLPTTDRGPAWFDSRAAILQDSPEDPRRILVISRDVTQQKQTEDRIKALLRQKEILLKEVHHRVKNHMSTIVGLLTHQSELITDTVAREALQDAAGRAQSMMVLYDRLYRSQDHGALSIRAYLEPLVNETVQLVQTGDSITATAEIAEFQLDTKTLAALGIIVTELITNSINHAFAGGASGRITLRVERQAQAATMVYADNGTPRPLSRNDRSGSGFGLQLIEMLVDQIGGSYTVHRGDGTTYRVQFPTNPLTD